MDDEYLELQKEKLRREIRSLRFERVRVALAIVGAATLVLGVFAQGYLSTLRSVEASILEERAELHAERVSTEMDAVIERLQAAKAELALRERTIEELQEELNHVRSVIDGAWVAHGELVASQLNYWVAGGELPAGLSEQARVKMSQALAGRTVMKVAEDPTEVKALVAHLKRDALLHDFWNWYVGRD